MERKFSAIMVSMLRLGESLEQTTNASKKMTFEFSDGSGIIFEIHLPHVRMALCR
jgi:hypothetical protein